MERSLLLTECYGAQHNGIYTPSNDVEFSFKDTSANITARNVHVTDDRPMSSTDVITFNRHQMVCSIVAATYEDCVGNNCNTGA